MKSVQPFGPFNNDIFFMGNSNLANFPFLFALHAVGVCVWVAHLAIAHQDVEILVKHLKPGYDSYIDIVAKYGYESNHNNLINTNFS